MAPDVSGEHIQRRSAAMKFRQNQVDRLLAGDLNVARSTLRHEIAETLLAQAVAERQAKIDAEFSSIIVHTHSDESVARSEASISADILATEARMLQVGLAEAVIRIDPPYLRAKLPSELIDLLQHQNPENKGKLLALEGDAKHCIGMLDMAVHLTHGNDTDGIDHGAPVDLAGRKKIQYISVLADRVCLQWTIFQEQQLRKDKILPPPLVVEGLLADVKIRFERQPDAPPEAIKAVLIDEEGEIFVDHLAPGYANVRWDGNTVPADLGGERHDRLAYDVLRALSFDEATAYCLGAGDRLSEGGGSLGAVMRDVDNALHKGRPVELSGDRLAEWILSCDPFINTTGSGLAMGPLPTTSVAELSVGGRGIL